MMEQDEKPDNVSKKNRYESNIKDYPQRAPGKANSGNENFGAQMCYPRQSRSDENAAARKSQDSIDHIKKCLGIEVFWRFPISLVGGGRNEISRYTCSEKA